jgi:hypothetical protein
MSRIALRVSTRPVPESRGEPYLLAALDNPSGAAPGSSSFELVFQNLCTTLIAIDDYCNIVWTSPGTGIMTRERTESFD